MSNSAAEKKEQLHIPGRTKVEYLCLTSHGCGPRLNPSSLVSDRASFRRVDQEPGTPNLGQSIKGPQIQESSTFTDGPIVQGFHNLPLLSTENMQAAGMEAFEV